MQFWGGFGDTTDADTINSWEEEGAGGTVGTLGVENIVAETVGICNEDEMSGSVAAEEVEVEMASVDGASPISNTSCAQIVEVNTLHV